MRRRSDDGEDDYFLVENANFAILFRKLQKSKFFGEPPHTSRGHIGTPPVDPTGEDGGDLSDGPNSQSQHVMEDLLANELCGRAWTFQGWNQFASKVVKWKLGVLWLLKCVEV